ncbi:uncharacterized protein ISCGN_026977 [Ixodes scapularis]
MDAAAEHAVRGCLTCQTADKSAKTFPAPLQPIPLPERPWEKLSIDIVGPIEEAPQRHRFVVTVMDYYSRWPEIVLASMCPSVVLQPQRRPEEETVSGRDWSSSESGRLSSIFSSGESVGPLGGGGSVRLGFWLLQEARGESPRPLPEGPARAADGTSGTLEGVVPSLEGTAPLEHEDVCYMVSTTALSTCSSAAAVSGTMPETLAAETPLRIWDERADSTVQVPCLHGGWKSMELKYRGKPRTARRGRANPHGSGSVETPLSKHLLSQGDPPCSRHSLRGQPLNDFFLRRIKEVILRDDALNGVKGAVCRDSDPII